MSAPLRPVTEDEDSLLTQISMFGSDGYPINRLGAGKWCWGPWRSVQGPPTVFKTKREAIASFERFQGVLLNAKGALAQQRALDERRTP